MENSLLHKFQPLNVLSELNKPNLICYSIIFSYLFIFVTFQEIKPREELIAFNNHATEKNEELPTTEMNEDAAALHEELINIFTESPAFDSR